MSLAKERLTLWSPSAAHYASKTKGNRGVDEHFKVNALGDDISHFLSVERHVS